MFSVPMFSVPMFSPPMFSGWRIGCEQSSRGVVSLAARGADDFQTRLCGFHAQVADDHVVNGGFHAGKSLGGTAGSFDFKSVEFENSFQGQQDGEIVVDQKNAAFHVASFNWSWRCSARHQLAAIFIRRSRELHGLLENLCCVPWSPAAAGAAPLQNKIETRVFQRAIQSQHPLV
jgi:hypothetical protein